jgi:hypothetical protein
VEKALAIGSVGARRAGLAENERGVLIELDPGWWPVVRTAVPSIGRLAPSARCAIGSGGGSRGAHEHPEPRRWTKPCETDRVGE